MEHVEKGEVKMSVYFLYVKCIGLFVSSGILVLLVVSVALSASANIWLSIWSSDPVSSDPKTKIPLQNMRLGVYAALELSFASAMFVGILTLIFASMNASIDLHSKTLLSIFRSPMSFFDTTPSGRIVNRFSKDVDTVDNVLPSSFQEFLVGALEMLAAAIVICITLPWLILIYIPLALLYYMMQKFFIIAANRLRRLDSVTRSPLYSRFSETIAGASTLRAFRLQRKFIQQLDEMIDTSLKNKYYFDVLCRWIGVRLDFLGNVMVISTALFAMFQRSSMDASTIALIITYANQITFNLCWLVYNAGMLESDIVSVERLHEYVSLKCEEAWETPSNRPPSVWPVQGNVRFRNYSTKYREGLPTVLHELTCDIHAGEKIGVVGRTGAGKSSLALSLFRITEATEGAIIIDGVDISKIGLHDLRNHLTIIPQDPVLYSGSLRMNLDPFDQHSDAELWKALELAHMKEHVLSLAAKLQHEIAEGGENLSVGQRQLVCLARALLRKTKILILDEATAAVDLETDELIQETIRQEFADCTVITIAHRINTILDSSRVIVMENGSIQEVDQPSTLLNDKKSLFYSLATFAGIVK